MIHSTQSRSPHLRFAAALLIAPVALAPIVTTPAQAQFFGRIVFDPTNYAQNVLQAARALQQINQQITQLQNEAQMLINQARNLASLPVSSLQRIQHADSNDRDQPFQHDGDQHSTMIAIRGDHRVVV